MSADLMVENLSIEMENGEPRLCATVKNEPCKLKDFRFFDIGCGFPLYYGLCHPWVTIFAYSGPGRGYGGRTFEITMQNGETRKLIGPWSGRIGIFNALGSFPKAMEITLINADSPIRHTTHILVDYVKPLLLAKGYDIECVSYKSEVMIEHYYQPKAL